MLILSLEIFRTLILGAIFIYFLWIGNKQQILRQKGWNWLLSGFLLLFIGSLVDISDEFESLSILWFLGKTPAEAVFEKIIGFTLGSILLSIGFIRWTPVIINTFKMEELLKESNKRLEEKVLERTGELEKSNKLLKENEEKFRTIFNKSSLLSFILSKKGIILEINAATTSFLNETRTDLLDKSIFDTSLCRESDVLKNAFNSILSKEEKAYYQFELPLLNTVGQKRIYEFTISPVREENNDIVMLIMTGFDITERKNITDLLMQAKQAADTANKAKSEFIARVSHELRTPMNSILGFTHVLKKSEDKEKQIEFINKIDISTHDLLNLINDIIEFSEIETGQAGLKNEKFSLRKIFSSIFMRYAKPAKDKNITLRIFTNDKIPAELVGMAAYFFRVIDTVVNNGIKFTERGSVEVEVQGKILDENKFNLTVEVSDTGIGIEKTKLSTIFTSFSQEEETTTRKYSGLGLGLTICIKLVTLLGGTIEVDSTKNAGSVFRIDISFDLTGESIEYDAFNYDTTGDGDTTDKTYSNDIISDTEFSGKSLEEYVTLLGTALENYDADSFSLLNIIRGLTDHKDEIELLSRQLEKYDFDSAKRILEEFKVKHFTEQ